MSVAPPPIFFPNLGYQVFTALVFFLGLSIISHFVSRRLQHESFTLNGLKNMPWSRLSVILMFCNSWLFILASGILVFGTGLQYSKAVCIVAIYLCIFFYSSTKFFVYAFLAEKVHIVWSPTAGRFESPVYLICMVSVSFYCIVMTLMLGGPIHEFSSNGTCIIGLKPFGYVPLLVYDVYISLFLTFMFVFPLFRSKLMSSSIRRLAVRTLIAAGISVLTSTSNITVLIILKGKEAAWINLCACSADIIINAIAIFWVSGSRSNPHHSSHVHVEHRSFRHTMHLSSIATKSHIESPSGANTQFPVQLEGDVTGGVDTFRPANSWMHRLLDRQKRPAPMPALQIAVTKEVNSPQTEEVQIRDSMSDNDNKVLIMGQ